MSGVKQLVCSLHVSILSPLLRGAFKKRNPLVVIWRSKIMTLCLSNPIPSPRSSNSEANVVCCTHGMHLKYFANARDRILTFQPVAFSYADWANTAPNIFYIIGIIIFTEINLHCSQLLISTRASATVGCFVFNVKSLIILIKELAVPRHALLWPGLVRL
jgi:hypothetical protein